MRVWGAFGAGPPLPTPPLYTIDWIFLLLFFINFWLHKKMSGEYIFEKTPSPSPPPPPPLLLLLLLLQSNTHTWIVLLLVAILFMCTSSWIIFFLLFLLSFSSFYVIIFVLPLPSCDHPIQPHWDCMVHAPHLQWLTRALPTNAASVMVLLLFFSSPLDCEDSLVFILNHNSLSLSPVWALQCNVRLVFFPPSYDCILCCNGLSPHSAFILLLMLLLQLKAIIYCRYEWGRVTDVTSF